MALAGLILILLLFVAFLFAAFVPAVLSSVAFGHAIITKTSRGLWTAAFFAVVASGMALNVAHLLFVGAGGLTPLERLAVGSALVLSSAAIITAGLRIFRRHRSTKPASSPPIGAKF